MKLTEKEIKLIEDFLERKDIKYLDVSSELLDHLATDFEQNSNYGLLEDYLTTKTKFIKYFAKKQQKTIHWSYQKQLWVQFAMFFYKPKFLLMLFGLLSLAYMFLQFFTLKEFSSVCYFILLILVCYPIFYQIKHRNAVKKVQSMQSLFTVTSLPMVFLHSFFLIRDTLMENASYMVVYCVLSILLGWSAVIIIEKDRKKVLAKYYQLVNKVLI